MITPFLVKGLVAKRSARTPAPARPVRKTTIAATALTLLALAGCASTDSPVEKQLAAARNFDAANYRWLPPEDAGWGGCYTHNYKGWC